MPDEKRCAHAVSGPDIHGPDESETGIDTGMLAPGAWLALWGMRHRVGLMLRKQPCDARLHEAFEANRAGDAARALDALIVVLGVSAVRMLDVRCPACPRLSADEALLLEACADGARFGDRAALRLIVELLPPAAARIASIHAAATGRVLREAGLGWDSPTCANGRRIRLAPATGLN